MLLRSEERSVSGPLFPLLHEADVVIVGHYHEARLHGAYYQFLLIQRTLTSPPGSMITVGFLCCQQVGNVQWNYAAPRYPQGR